MPRTDIHRPSAILPSQYDYVGFAYAPRESDTFASRADGSVSYRAIEAHMANTGGHYSTHDHGGTCYVCGASAIYLCHLGIGRH
jgi:hypothetical protein